MRSYRRGCAHTYSLSFSLSSTQSCPSQTSRSEACRCSRAPAPPGNLGYLFVARGSEVAGLLSVLSAAGVLWVGTLLSSTKSLHSQEEN